MRLDQFEPIHGRIFWSVKLLKKQLIYTGKQSEDSLSLGVVQKIQSMIFDMQSHLIERLITFME